MKTAVPRWLPIPILAAGALAAWLLAQGRASGVSAPPPPLPPRVAVLEVRPGEHTVVVRAHGIVEPRTEIALVAEVPGRIETIAPSLAAGGFFAKDEVLVRLDRGDAALSLERAEAVVMRTRSEVRLAEATLERRRELARSRVASPAQIEQAEHAHALAAAGLREARAARDQARRDLARTRIAAPFAGRVRVKHADVGQFVTRGTPLATVYAVDYAEVRLPVPVPDVAYLDLPLAGAGLDEAAPGTPAVLRAQFGGRRVEWPARIVRAEGEIAPRSRMLHVVARVDDPYGLGTDAPRPPLTVGLFVEAEIRGRTLPGVVELPRSALRGDDWVLVADDAAQVRARRVTVLRRAGDVAVIGAGLAAGERVLVSAAAAVEGALVRAEVVEPGAAPDVLAGLSP